MLADAESLAGRLQRGRGDAMRELLAMPRSHAAAVLVQAMQCEQAEGGLVFIESVLALQPDLSPWLQWVERLPRDGDGDYALVAFNLVGELACRGEAACLAPLRRRVLGGAWAELALAQFLREGLELDCSAWRAIAPSLGDEDIALHCEPEREVWQQLAREDARFAAIVAVEAERRLRVAAAQAWSPAKYANATRSRDRWRVLEALLRDDAAMARPLLIDGLWDGDVGYRERCIEHCDLAWPGVRSRLEELARSQGAERVALRKLAGG